MMLLLPPELMTKDLTCKSINLFFATRVLYLILMKSFPREYFLLTRGEVEEVCPTFHRTNLYDETIHF